MTEVVLAESPGIDLRLTLAPLRHGPQDPTMRIERGRVWRALRTPEGPAAIRYAYRAEALTAAAWGPGAAWALDRAADAVGLNDDVASFTPRDRLMQRLLAMRPGLRMCRSNAVLETLVPTIIEQKVTTVEAHRAYRYLAYATSEPAPGPMRLMLPPDPKVLASLPYDAFHRFGLERRRADFIRCACSYAKRLEETVTMPRDAAVKRLRALPGIGPWTVAEVERTVYGDPDAVRPNDFHLPHTVAWVLAGERRADDARMMQLLEPYRGHRARAALLIELSGNTPERRAPRQRIRDFSRY
ncbi:MAG TPA: DNA-3-methyladenine glycosylase 2 family protein [Actinomycetota bacterium]|nr:DNA-3-methyladenine glycosylase 2 family protein [Actinomycetota bacterium]